MISTCLLILLPAWLIQLGMYGQILRLGFVLMCSVRVRRKNPWPDVARPGFRWWLPIWQFCTTPLAWRVTSLTFQAFQLKTPDPWEEDAGSLSNPQTLEDEVSNQKTWLTTPFPSTNGNYYNEMWDGDFTTFSMRWNEKDELWEDLVKKKSPRQK